MYFMLETNNKIKLKKRNTNVKVYLVFGVKFRFELPQKHGK